MDFSIEQHQRPPLVLKGLVLSGSHLTLEEKQFLDLASLPVSSLGEK